MKHVLVYGMTDNPGGIETYLLNFFSRVQGKSVMLDFVSDFPGISGGEQLRQRGAKLYFIPAKSRDLWGHWKGLWQILRRHEEYETVYFNILDAGAAVTMLIPFLLGRKIVVHAHNNSTDKVRLHKFCRPLLNWITAARVTCSDAGAEYMFGAHGKDALFIPNAIDAARYRFDEGIRIRKRRELGLEDSIVICHVGRLSRQKNPMGLIDIFEAVHRKCPRAVLLSVGTGEMADAFGRYIEEKQLRGCVRCLGVRSDVSEILQAADVFLLPSLYEGLPISLLEAQASGLPCVISDAISRQAVVTEPVRRVDLNADPDIWADVILDSLNMPRRDTIKRFTQTGFDISCCESHDKMLIDLF